MLTEAASQITPEALTDWAFLRTLAKNLVRHYFKDDADKPFEMTDGQADIFLTVFLRLHPRNQVIACTQYGKSSVVSMALILRSQAFAEDWAIVTGEMPKSMIIMEKAIQHLFDHEQLWQQVELDPNETLDRLKRQRTRQNLMWKRGGGIRVFTADARNRQRVKSALSGFGSPNIVEDEASLIPNDVQAMIMRMLGGHKDNYLLKIGNPWQPNPNHFFQTWYQDNYNRIFIDVGQALAEGRFDPEFVEEMRSQPFFDILYECRFPAEDAIVEGGYRKIITESEIQQAFLDANTNIIQSAEGQGTLGVDVGRGGNYTVYTLRYDNVAAILERNRDKDLMSQVARVRRYMEQYNVPSSRVNIDDVGVGGGITDRLRELGLDVNGIREGGQAEDSTRFANIRAEMFWKAADWIRKGGKLISNPGFMQLALVNYKENSSSKLVIEPKADLIKRGADSPDDADSFSLTFAPSSQFEAGDFDIL